MCIRDRRERRPRGETPGMLVVLLAFFVAGAFGVWAVVTVAWRVAQRRNIDPMDLMLELGLAEWPSPSPRVKQPLSARIQRVLAQASQARPRVERPVPRAARPAARVPSPPRRPVIRTRWVEEIGWSDPLASAPVRPLRASLRD